MIASLQFRNFRVLRDATLPLSRFTLIVGANGSGKSTALQALQGEDHDFQRIVTVGMQPPEAEAVEVVVRWGPPHEDMITTMQWRPDRRAREHESTKGHTLGNDDKQTFDKKLSGIRLYSLDACAIASPVQLSPNMSLQTNGAHLAGVLDRLRDLAPERFEALNDELGRWLPEFDRILFDTPQPGHRSFLLRTRQGHHAIPASDLSQGTLLALTILTLAYLPDPPPIVCLEEPDRGMHPRLLREVQDALYRLSYPENFGETREPVQVLATTHSPYFLDLFKDHPEEIVIAHRVGQAAYFERLSDRPDIDEILRDAPLGEVWYSGVLGGVPAEP
jgi:predicted ATPase